MWLRLHTPRGCNCILHLTSGFPAAVHSCGLLAHCIFCSLSTLCAHSIPNQLFQLSFSSQMFCRFPTGLIHCWEQGDGTSLHCSHFFNLFLEHSYKSVLNFVSGRFLASISFVSFSGDFFSSLICGVSLSPHFDYSSACF